MIKDHNRLLKYLLDFEKNLEKNVNELRNSLDELENIIFPSRT